VGVIDVYVLKTPGPIFLQSFRKGDFLSKEKQVSFGDIRNTVSLLSSPPNNYFKTFRYSHYTEIKT